MGRSWSGRRPSWRREDLEDMSRKGTESIRERKRRMTSHDLLRDWYVIGLFFVVVLASGTSGVFELELGQDFHDAVAALDGAVEAEDELRRELECRAGGR